MKVTTKHFLSLHLVYALKMYSIKIDERKKVFHDKDFYFLARARVKVSAYPSLPQTAVEKRIKNFQQQQPNEREKQKKIHTKIFDKQNSGKN